MLMLDDNCVIYGCINVLLVFYEQIVYFMFEKGGVFYILLDKDLIVKMFLVFVQSCVVVDGDEKKIVQYVGEQCVCVFVLGVVGICLGYVWLLGWL